jgi:hypothetical protein
MPFRSAVSLLTAVLLLAGCDSGTDFEDVSIEGTWSGRFEDFDFTLQLDETGGNVTGTGGIETIPITVTGTRDGVGVDLTLTADQFLPLDYNAEIVASNEMFGSLNGSGFTGDTLRIRRQ